MELYDDYILGHGQFNIEDILYGEQPGEWTVPTWAKIGDIVFFIHAKYAFSTISALRTKLNECRDDYTITQYNLITDWLNRGKDLHKRYGGKIFAICRVTGAPFEDQGDDDHMEHIHWKSRIYADIGDKWLLKRPIDISEFRDFIRISRQGSITPVYNREYSMLKDLILSKNPDAPRYFIESVAASVPLSKINRFNWLSIASEYRRSFILEQQFRSFYTDYFLRSLGDRKTLYRECRCKKSGCADSFVDNIILIGGRYLPVEIKLNIHTVANIQEQVKKYCHDEHVYLDSGVTREIPARMLYTDSVLIIDTECVYLYRDQSEAIHTIIDLDIITLESDIRVLREKLIDLLH